MAGGLRGNTLPLDVAKPRGYAFAIQKGDNKITEEFRVIIVAGVAIGYFLKFC
jgi:hypothetical protein